MTRDPINRWGDMKEVEARVREEGIIAIVRGDFGMEQMLDYAAAIRENGVAVLEVTLNSSGALEAISRLRAQFGDSMLIGAGTVRNTAQFIEATGAGAQFTVAPGSEIGTIEAAQSENILHLPGVFTASEVERAYGLGIKTVKLFPADQLGPGYLKALRAPLDDVSFVPTGGIGPDNVAAYKAAGAVAVGVGGSLIKAGISVEEVARRAAALRAGWDST